MRDTLPLLTKVRPPARRLDRLRRQRLLDTLLENTDRKLLLVIAPAGYGKSTLLADLAYESPVPVAWLTLDPADGDPRSFVEYLVRAIQQAYPDFGATTLASLSYSGEFGSRSAELARTLAADVHLHVPGVCLVVLDDFHEVNESSAVTTFLDELLRIVPENLRIVLSGRTLPNLTVSRLAVENQLFGIGDSHLRFTADEIAALFRNRYQVELDADEAEAMVAQTEGWVAGLLLSVHGLRDQSIESLARLTGGRSSVATYLADETYDRQPEEMRRFLLASSTMRTLTEQACAALLGPGDWMSWLADAERANLFVTALGGLSRAYRYHQLFREFLQTRLRREEPERFRELHRRAARFYISARDWPQAIEHFHEADALDECARLVAEVAPELEREGRWYLLARTIDQLPAELRETDGRLLLSRARAAAMTGDLKAAEQGAWQALAQLEEDADPLDRAWALQCLGNAQRRLGQTAEAMETLELARRLATFDEALVASVRRDLAGCYGVRGDFPSAAREYRAACDYFERVGNAHEAARAAYGVGVAFARQGQVDRALEQYAVALERWRSLGDLGNGAATLNNMGYLLIFRGAYEEARSMLDEGLAQAQQAGHRIAEASLHDSLGGLLLSTGDLTAAMRSYRTAYEVASDAGDLWAATSTTEGAGVCAVLQGDLESAERWFERGEALADRQQSEYRRLQIAVGRGVLFLQAGQVDRAVTVLTAGATELERLETRRDLVRARLWLAQAHYRQGDRRGAGIAFQHAAADATALDLPALLDLPARWDPEAFADFPAGAFAALQADTLARVQAMRPTTRPILLRPEGPPRFRAFSFGRARVLSEDGTSVEWGREKARELFFYLLHSGAVRSGRVVADLWPETAGGRARASLYSAVYALRRATGPDVVQAEDRTYALRSDAVLWNDIGEFDRIYSLIRVEADGERRLALMTELAALYSGPLLDDVDGEWATDLRRMYETRFLDVLESLVASQAASGNWNACLAASIKGLAADPDCQTFYTHAEKSYRALGKPWAAARLARRARQRLTGTHGA